MSTPDWIATLEIGPIGADRAGRNHPGRGSRAQSPVRAISYELPRGPPRLLSGARRPGDQEVSGDEVRAHLSRSVLPRLATEGWILDTESGDWDPVTPRVRWWGETRGRPSGGLRGPVVGGTPRGFAIQGADAASRLRERPRGSGPREELQGTPGRGPCRASGSSRARSSACWARTARERRRPST